MRKAGLVGLALLCALAVTACGDDNSSSSTSTAASTSTPVAANGPAITALAGPAEVSCSTDEATVPLTWATSNATAVDFSVDGQPLSAAAGYPTSGTGNVPVPCDNGTHEVSLTATGEGSITETITVGTVQKEKPVTRPIVLTLNAPDTVTCSGDTTEVELTWTTKNASAVGITVDGQPLPADAGQPVNGSSDVPVPCDGKTHRLGLIAYGQGNSAGSYVVQVTTLPKEPSTPTIADFTIPAEVSCTAGQQTEVAASWETKNTEGVDFEVNGQPLSAAAGYPASGSGNIPVPCNNRQNTITISTAGGGSVASRTLNVDMVAKTAPVLRPAITVFTMPVRVPCTVNPRKVTAKYRTANANYVTFQLDGVAIPKLGTLPLNGAAKLPIPCDGTQHKVTLVVEGQGNSVAQITRPITAVPQSGAVTAEETTTAP